MSFPLRPLTRWLLPPPACLLCAARSDQPPRPLCRACAADLPWSRQQCRRCALPLPLPLDGQVCGECLRRPPAYEQAIAPWRYAFPLDSLINRFKHQAAWPLGRLLGELLAEHLRQRYAEGLPRPARLLPVPLAPRRERRRGFNQAQQLAERLAGELDLHCDPHSLRRVLDTPAQQGLDATVRRRNLRHAFALAPASDVRGLHLALVDDVLTTGATTEHLSRLLRRAGAARVDVYCLARTPKPG
ncbi:ComF family protein [Pseudomonas aeruginosa]|uniref:ComF family protein n=1 Tax=Pseudomonas aeruginosa TaxID=287 RepID=UPI00057A1D5E|nr:ComF family protein [Pseudomonas aeruginosa]MBG4298395.1 ComF family protein [Pseudomonas aeruginosa]MBH9456178.1 ComF family protein [Pseudomonas aeruginosa]MBH9466644.1 ComF family protein [Pseudomonas aeruginosa]MBN0173487.1 ComF family protein [Pseudomonas aeruginosa]MCO3738872.1 ComF family protein [Pseudomonas aeruginosa]